MVFSCLLVLDIFRPPLYLFWLTGGWRVCIFMPMCLWMCCFLLFLIFRFTPLCPEKTPGVTWAFLNPVRLTGRPHTCVMLQNVPCVLGENVRDTLLRVLMCLLENMLQSVCVVLGRPSMFLWVFRLTHQNKVAAATDQEWCANRLTTPQPMANL